MKQAETKRFNNQNPPSKKRYGYFGRWKGCFLKKFRKRSKYYCDFIKTLLIGYF